MRGLVRGLFVGVLILHSASTTRSQSVPASLQRTQLSIEERSPSCEGCPERLVTFRAGAAEFKCLGGCAVPGTRIERYPADAFEALVRAFLDAGFFSLPTQVGACFDCGIVTLKYRDERRVHEVVDVGFARLPSLAALEARMRKAAEMFDHYSAPSPANYQKLLDAGWDPNEVLDDAGGTMLNYAVAGMDHEAVKLLLSRGARVNRRALEGASTVGMLEPLWTSARVTRGSSAAQSLLMIAAASNWTPNISWLIKQGVDVNAPEPEFRITPLMAAARAGYRDSVELLLERGARIDARDASGNTVLWFGATLDASPSVLEVFLKRGIAADATNIEGRTALMHAAESCAASNIRRLLAVGANASLRDKAGKTARDLIPAARTDRFHQCQAARLALGSS
jgi:ankyrin repeat protein